MRKLNKLLDYDILTKLGEGSFGEVLLGAKAGRRVAIKKISKKQIIKVLPAPRRSISCTSPSSRRQCSAGWASSPPSPTSSRSTRQRATRTTSTSSSSTSPAATSRSSTSVPALQSRSITQHRHSEENRSQDMADPGEAALLRHRPSRPQGTSPPNSPPTSSSTRRGSSSYQTSPLPTRPRSSTSPRWPPRSRRSGNSARPNNKGRAASKAHPTPPRGGRPLWAPPGNPTLTQLHGSRAAFQRHLREGGGHLGLRVHPVRAAVQEEPLLRRQ